MLNIVCSTTDSIKRIAIRQWSSNLFWDHQTCNLNIGSKFLVVVMLFITSNIGYSQESENSGIQWAKGLSWQQIRQKAKKENKYIFVDCYATWCAPCKKMDAQTFSKKDVWEFLKDKFIAVKIQMDSTLKDSEFVKDWYKDAEMVKKEFIVSSFPTLLFFNPKGELVEKVIGFHEADSFISIAQSSLKPGKKYEDSYKEFNVLIDKYQKGIKEYKHFPKMIAVAKKTKQNELKKVLSDELHRYLLTLSNKELLNRNYIEFINEYAYVNNNNSDNNLSRIFITDGKKVDAVMNIKDYSKYALNGMISRGYVKEFLGRFKSKEQNASASIPWDSLYNDIASQFTKDIAELNTLIAKVDHFGSYRDARALRHFIEVTKKYGLESVFIDPVIRANYINYMAWIYCVKRESGLNDTRYISELLKKAIDNTIEGNKADSGCHPYELVDTYALLLHKIGDNKNAIENQMKAIDLYLDCGGGTKEDDQHQIMLKQLGNMQNGQVNFSGNWKLNIDKTKFNNTPRTPAATRLFVEHKAGEITFQRNDRPKEILKIDSTAFIEISGAESKTKVSIKPTPDKQGLIETRIYTYPKENVGVVAVKKTRTWTLSADKKTLTIKDHIETTQNGVNFDMVLVYERQ